MLGFGQTTATQTSTMGVSSAVKDYEIVQPQQINGQQDQPIDGVSSLSFSPVAEYLAASSWDGLVRCWQVGQDTVLNATIQHQLPVLSCCWSSDGTKLFSGSADKQAKMLDLGTGQQVQVAQHDGPISAVRFISSPQAQLLVTGSWDKTVKVEISLCSSSSSSPSLPFNALVDERSLLL